MDCYDLTLFDFEFMVASKIMPRDRLMHRAIVPSKTRRMLVATTVELKETRVSWKRDAYLSEKAIPPVPLLFLPTKLPAQNNEHNEKDFEPLRTIACS